MTKPTFRPINAEEVTDDVLDQLSDRLGVPTLVRPRSKAVDTARRQDGKPSRRPAGAAARRHKKVTFRSPEAVFDALKRDALDRRISVRVIILSALKAAGYPVIDQDLLPGAGGTE